MQGCGIRWRSALNVCLSSNERGIDIGIDYVFCSVVIGKFWMNPLLKEGVASKWDGGKCKMWG